MSGIFDQVINYAPPSLLKGTVTYKGTWSAATNTPTLINPPDSTTNGFYYVVSAAGTQFSLVFNIGDWIISNGSAWEKVDNTDAVSSVFGRTGAVVGVSTDYSSVGINSTAIGATTPSTGAFSTLSATGITTVAAGSAALPAIVSTTGTADTGLWFPAADTIATSTAGSERMRIDSSGNVGIGTPPTTDRLELLTGSSNYAIKVFASASNFALIRFLNNAGSSQDATIGTSGTNQLSFYTNGFNERMRLTDTGLAVTGTLSATGITSITNSTASTSTTTGALKVTGGLGVAGAAFIGSTLNVTGNAGIGNSATSDIRLYMAAATVAGSTTASAIQLIESIDSTKTSQYIAVNSRPYTATAAFTLSDLTHFTANPFTFGVGSTVTAQTGFWATSNMTGATNNWGFRGSIAAGSGRYNLYMDGTAQNYLLGKTGIGQTPSATDTLAVTGTTLLTGNTAITGTLSATGTITSTVASGTVTLESTAPYGTGYKAIRLGNTGSTLTVGVESSAGGSLLTSATGYAGVVSSNSTILQLGASNTIVATLSSGAVAITGTLSTTNAITSSSPASTNTTTFRSEGYIANGAVDTRCGTIRNQFDTNTGYSTFWTAKRLAGGSGYQMILGTAAGAGDVDIATISSTGLAVTGTLSCTGNASVTNGIVGIGGGKLVNDGATITANGTKTISGINSGILIIRNNTQGGTALMNIDPVGGVAIISDPNSQFSTTDGGAGSNKFVVTVSGLTVTILNRWATSQVTYYNYLMAI